jgi:hypothetical protein
MRKIISALILLSVLFIAAPKIFADEVNVNLSVVERKSTDTINDFDLSSVSEGKIANQENGAVKGVANTVSFIVRVFQFMKKVPLLIIGWVAKIFK